MTNLDISIFGKKIFSEIIKEIKYFSNYKIIYYDNIDTCVQDSNKKNKILICFIDKDSQMILSKIKGNNFPLILILRKNVKDILPENSYEKLIMPFTISDLKKKIILASAKSKFKKNSLINLNGYIIDKNERKIKKNNIEVQLSEKEVNFLILFSKNSEPLNRNLVLKKVWKYASNSETHTLETHIHRLRKKILKNFNDNNFIKNNDKGYYV